jgi:hypothetical protein
VSKGEVLIGRLVTSGLILIIIEKNLRLRRAVLPILLFITQSGMGQVKFSTVASSREIGRSDYVQVEFVVENAKEIEQLTPPSFADFHVVQGPIQSSGMSIINGDMSQYKSLSFVLQPVKSGKYTIGGATAIVDGKPMRSNPVTIEVNANSSPGNSPPVSAGPSNPFAGIQPVWPGEASDMDREYILKPGENIDDKIRKNMFVKLQVSKTSCYVGEPIVATYKLYSRLQSESRVTKHPSLNGFSVYDMIEPSGDAVSVETVNGKPFTVHTIRKTQLIPLQAGTIELDPVEIENTVHFVKSSQAQRRRGNSLQDLFDQLTGESNTGVPVEKNVTLDSKPVAITVKALPEESRPGSYNGAVGHFAIEAGIENKNVNAQDAAVLKVTVKGNGNLPVVNAPLVKWPSGFETYDASEKENIDKTKAPMAGTKTFEYSFIPDKKGNYSIPAIQFSYFDPLSASYKSIESKPLDLEVAAAKGPGHGSKNTLPQSPSMHEKAIGAKEFFRQHLEWFFIIMILSGLAVYLLRQNRRLKKNQQPAEDPVAQTLPEADHSETVLAPPDPLLKSRQLLEQADYKGFYNELNLVVWSALSNRLQLPSSELNKYNITQALRTKGWGEETTTLLKNILNECEMSLYTPDYNSRDMQLLLEHTESLLNQLG